MKVSLMDDQWLINIAAGVAPAALKGRNVAVVDKKEVLQ